MAGEIILNGEQESGCEIRREVINGDNEIDIWQSTRGGEKVSIS